MELAVARLLGITACIAAGDDGSGDGEAHAGACYAFALTLATIKLVENHLLLQGLDACAAVGDADG